MRKIRIGFVAAVLLFASGCATERYIDEESLKRASDINSQLGVAYMRQGNYELALAKLKKALVQNEDNANAHHYIAELYRRLGKMKDAGIHFNEALSLTPNDSSLQNNYGVFLCAQKKYDKAQKYFDKVLDDPLYKTKAQVYENMGLCAQRKGDIKSAEDNLLRAIKMNKRLPNAYLAIAQINFDKQLYRQSERHLYKYLEMAKHNSQSLWLGILLENRKGNKNRVASYSILLKGKFPDSRETQLLRKLEARGTL